MSLFIIHTGTKANTLRVLREANRLYSDQSDLMSQIEYEDKVTDWQIAVFECRVCAHMHTGILPVGGILEDVECPNCRSMSADVIEDSDES